MNNPLVAAPEYKGFLGANYNLDKWTANAGLQYVAGLYTSVGATETKENFCLLNLSLSYQLTDNINLWARGENLLAQKYEINLGYPMPRATFMGGVKVNF
jgi:iron complex outermembrane receptor protein